jgi:hypothetical protein
MGWMANVGFQEGPKFFSSPASTFLRVKQLRREADHSSSGAEYQNGGYISTPPYIFMAYCLIN